MGASINLPGFDDNDRQRVKVAIGRAEARTSGEIFVVVAQSSGEDRLIPLLVSALVALLLPLPLDLLTQLPAGRIHLVQLAGFTILALVTQIPAVARLLVPRSLARERARERAGEQFLARNLHATEGRTGVLVFVSFAERHAEVIADTGIAAKVAPDFWDATIDKLTAEIRLGRLGDGLIGAVERIGALLAEHFPPRDGDSNEIENDVVVL